MNGRAQLGIKRTTIDRVKVDRTDPDYSCKYIARMAREYADIPEEWKGTFIEGIPALYRKDVMEKIFDFMGAEELYKCAKLRNRT